ncbi:hypothetical protein [Streptomyces sp. NPDC088760]|uniref:hypothetical protein n=1 Tax=Streptomyces sp. NPDC088760 TaxID=3365890 RepID=UPI00381E13EF
MEPVEHPEPEPAESDGAESSGPAESADVVGSPEAPGPVAGPPAPAPGPDDATVQLDDVRLGAPGTAAAVDEPRGSDGPVFVDESGRRSRRFRRLGQAVAVACAGYAAVIVATLLSGNSAAPWLPVPGQHEDKPASKVDTSPLPSASTTPTPPGTGAVTGPGVGTAVTGTAVPGGGSPVAADVSASVAPSAATASAPGTTASPSPAVPSTGETPAPSASGTATAPAPTPTPPGRTHTPPGRTRHPHPKLSL